MRRYLFIRDDDVWTLERSFVEFFELMFKLKIPVVYGVIPARLEKEAAIFLKKAKVKEPNLLDIVQHGYAHQNYAPQGEKKYEFGENRTYEQQFSDIERGMKLMRQWFGPLMTEGFTPPYHAEDRRTIKAIEKLKVPLYSARLKVPLKKKTFIDLPAQVWANKSGANGEPESMDFRRIGVDLFDCFSTQQITGMVFRHHMLRHPSDAKVLAALMQVIIKERRQGKVQTVLFSELLKAGRK